MSVLLVNKINEQEIAIAMTKRISELLGHMMQTPPAFESENEEIEGLSNTHAHTVVHFMYFSIFL